MGLKDTHMTAAQAADFLSLTRQQIVSLCTSNKLVGAEKVGTAWLIPRESVEVYQYLKRKKRPK
ncbi:MAG: helix-turn-helix domain-containing protein [Synergistaceae bacterium]|nr:helix-turn-helix domain-containing protein [Synergistaceae bacterium]